MFQGVIELLLCLAGFHRWRRKEPLYNPSMGHSIYIRKCTHCGRVEISTYAQPWVRANQTTQSHIKMLRSVQTYLDSLNNHSNG